MRLIEMIMELFLGHKYYATTFHYKNNPEIMINSTIWKTKKEAEEHKREIMGMTSLDFYEIVSFRSKKDYE